MTDAPAMRTTYPEVDLRLSWLLVESESVKPTEFRATSRYGIPLDLESPLTNKTKHHQFQSRDKYQRKLVAWVSVESHTV